MSAIYQRVRITCKVEYLGVMHRVHTEGPRPDVTPEGAAQAVLSLMETAA